MKRSLKTVVTLASVILLLFTALAPAKELPPAQEKMQKLSFPKYKEFSLKNGIDAIVIEHHEQPLVTVAVVLKAGGGLDPWEKIGLSGFTTELLNKGTKTRTADELAVWIESAGGSVGNFSGDDYVYISVSILSEFLDTAYEYLADIIMNPVFPESELEIHRKRVKTSLEFELSQPSSMAARYFSKIVYGDHPYAKAPTPETVEAVSRDDIVAFHKKNFVANNALITVVGDVKTKETKKSLEKYFGLWATGVPNVIDYTQPPARTSSQVYLYHRPGSVQTNFRVGHLGLRPTDPDWPAVIVGNKLFGGGSDARLFSNLREKKGWTYGIYSSFSRSTDIGVFQTNGAVKGEATDSALVELIKEMDRLVNEPIPEDEVQNAENYLIGNFPITIETPEQIANQVIQTKLLGLGKKHLETYRDELAKVTPKDVSRVMKAHIHPDKVAIVLVGDATAIMDKVKTELATDVALFDIEGHPLSLEALAVEPVYYEYQALLLEDHSATYGVSVQTMQLGDMNISVQKKQGEGAELVQVSTKIAGMITLDQTMIMNAGNLSPVSYKSEFAAGPMNSTAELIFSGKSGKGTVKGAEDEAPKDVSINLIDGTILDSSLEFAISLLPLTMAQKYRFPVVDTDSGDLQNMDVEVVEEVPIEVPAGSFDTFKLKVKGAKGESLLYVTKKIPHLLIKQEIPAQALNIELKALN